MDTEELKPWPLCGYAPGNYFCKCSKCERQFEGDKRAIVCLECAVTYAKSAMADQKAALSPSPAPDMREALVAATASLAAAISLLERSPKTAAPSNRMFDQMLTDYRRALRQARAVLMATR